MGDPSLLVNPSELIGGSYALNRVCHRTVCGVVYEAARLRDGQLVSLTLLAAPPVESVISNLQSESNDDFRQWLPEVLDFSIDPAAVCYLVTKAVAGDWLDDVLAREGPLEVGLAARLMLELCAELAAAPVGSSLVRALEPESVFLQSDADGVRRLQLSWLGLLAPERSRHGNQAEHGEPQALVELLGALVGQAAIVASPALAEIVERALGPDTHQRYTERRELMDALLPLARSSSGRAPRMASALPRLDEDIQLSVFRPRSITCGRWYKLLVFVHLADARPGDEAAVDPIAEVQRRAAVALGAAAASYVSTRQEGLIGLPEGGKITLLPQVPGLEFNPRSRSFEWHEDVHEESFQLRAKSALPGTALRGTLSAYLGTVLLADVSVKFVIVPSEVGEPEQLVPERATSYRKIFASYSHQDARIVSDFDLVVSALGDRYLVDVRDLRSGEVWNEALERLIDEADIFQLFWSTSSMRSEFCRREWEYALTRRKQIRPVFWEQPMPRDERSGLPPPALDALHFARLGPAVPPANDSVTPPKGSVEDVPVPRAKRWSGLAFASSGIAALLLGGMAMLHGAEPGAMLPPDPREGGTGAGIKKPQGELGTHGGGDASLPPSVAIGKPTAPAHPPRPSIAIAEKSCFIRADRDLPPYGQVGRSLHDSPMCGPRSIAAYRPADLPDRQRYAAEGNACSRIILYDCERAEQEERHAEGVPDGPRPRTAE